MSGKSDGKEESSNEKTEDDVNEDESDNNDGFNNIIIKDLSNTNNHIAMTKKSSYQSSTQVQNNG